MPTRPALAPVGKYDGLSVRSAMPGGNEPAMTDHTYVPLPPVALNGVSICPMLHVPNFAPSNWDTGGAVPAGSIDTRNCRAAACDAVSATPPDETIWPAAD